MEEELEKSAKERWVNNGCQGKEKADDVGNEKQKTEPTGMGRIMESHREKRKNVEQ